MEKNPKQMTDGGTSIGELRDWYAGQALAGLLASGPESFRTEVDIYGLCFRAADRMLAARQIDEPAPLGENESVKSQTKQDNANQGQRCADKSETVRITGQSCVGPTKTVSMNGLLYLTIPHLTNAEQNNAQRDKERIFIACCESWHSHRNSGNNKRYGPLSMIAQFFDIHRRNAPFAEIKLRVHLQQDGSISQEIVLPRGWIVVD
jgi:hypothetical protein